MARLKVKISNLETGQQVIHKYKDFTRFIDRYTRHHSTPEVRDILSYDRKKLIYIIVIIIFLLLLIFNEGLTL